MQKYVISGGIKRLKWAKHIKIENAEDVEFQLTEDYVELVIFKDIIDKFQEIKELYYYQKQKNEKTKKQKRC